MKTGLKKLISVIICLIMLLGAIGIGAGTDNSFLSFFTIKSSAIKSGYLTYTVKNQFQDNQYAALTACDKAASGTIVVADYVGGNAVKQIYTGVFSGCTGITGLSVSSGNYTFYSENNCVIKRSNKELIAGCKNSVIPDGITSIGDYAFNGCTGLTSITIPDSVTSIGAGAFSDCTGLTSITIPNSVTSIGGSAFSGCTGLTSITIPEGVTSIGGSAFEGCTGLTSITIPNSVTRIDSFTFEGCTGLTSITIPDSVTSIDARAFEGCTGLTSITMSNGITSIRNNAFSSCTGLTSIAIPEGVTSIDYSAFEGCTGLTSITIPNSVASIDGSAFSGCSGLTSLNVLSGNTVYHSAGNCIIETESKTLVIGCKNSTIPTDGSVTSIGRYAFDGCSGLTRITIPDSVTSIGARAFYRCTGLTNITIPDSVTTIGDSAFSSCSGLTNIIIPENDINIGNYAFYQCGKLTSITIPDSVTSIGEYAFNYCKDVIVPDSVTTVSEHAFGDGYSWNPVVFYSGSANTSSWGAEAVYRYYDGDLAFTDSSKKEVAYCRRSAKNISVPNNVTSISKNAFYDCKSLTTIKLPAGITRIGDNAFYNTAYYNNASNWSDNMLYIGKYLIKGKTDLAGNKSVKSGTTCIADSALSGCNKIITLTVPDSVNYIGSNAFGNVTNVAYTGTSTGSPWGAKCLNGYADGNFVYSDSGKAKLVACSGLATGSVVIPASTDTIGNNAFSACSTLTNIYIPVNVTRIGNGAFSSTALSDVYYEGSTVDKLGISFGDYNSKITDATWHYNSKKSDMPQAAVYTLTYNANGGSGAPAKQTGNGYVTISNTKPTRSGYTFLGWATGKSATSAQYGAGSLINLDKNITLYAVWQKGNTPGNPDNPPSTDIPEADVIKGNSADNKKTYNYRTTVTFTANVPEGGSVQWYVDGSPAGNGSTLSVKDKTNDYTVKVVVTDKNGNKTMDEEQVTIKHGFFDILIWFFVHLFNPGAYDVKQ